MSGSAVQEVACPNCKKRGGVRARKDAYADHRITMDGKWHFDSTAVMDAVQAFECFECSTELTQEAIEKENGISLD